MVFSKIFVKTNKKPTLAFNAMPFKKSWGGGNQWLQQLTRLAEYQGFNVVNELQPNIDCILVLHSLDTTDATFHAKDIAEYKKRFPKVKVLHRINENDARKGTNHVDDAIANMNRNADATVFVSDWLKQYHQKKWSVNSVHSTSIINGADSRFFHPFGADIWNETKPFRIVTHHWSDNWNKGFDVYQKIDESIHNGMLKKCELVVIGRWPKEISWKAAKTHSPASGVKLADLLRTSHAYVTGTKNEPGAMHYIEGMQCGLPLIYRTGGGGVSEVANGRGAVEFTDDIVGAIGKMQSEYHRNRSQLIKNLPSGEKMAAAYLDIVTSLLLGE